MMQLTTLTVAHIVNMIVVYDFILLYKQSFRHENATMYKNKHIFK